MNELNENIAASRCTNPAILEKMIAASVDIRLRETEATTALSTLYKEKKQRDREHFAQFGEWPGGWNSIHSEKDTVARLGVEAVSIENQTRYVEEWIIGECWKSETWVVETIARLKQESAENNAYYDARFERWEQWKQEKVDVVPGIEEKKLKYIEDRGSAISLEIDAITVLGQFGTTLRSGGLPEPSGSSRTADNMLAALYRRRLLKAA
jgi:hypothetical protein